MPEPSMSEQTYAAIMDELVHESAPSRFAVVQDYGTRVDGRVAAYGIATTEGATVIDDGGVLSLRDADSSALIYARPPHVTARVVWIDAEPQVDQAS
jgi:hypothetical protein